MKCVFDFKTKFEKKKQNKIAKLKEISDHSAVGRYIRCRVYQCASSLSKSQ